MNQTKLANQVVGVITAVRGQIAEVELESEALPFLYEILNTFLNAER